MPVAGLGRAATPLRNGTVPSASFSQLSSAHPTHHRTSVGDTQGRLRLTRLAHSLPPWQVEALAHVAIDYGAELRLRTRYHIGA